MASQPLDSTVGQGAEGDVQTDKATLGAESEYDWYIQVKTELDSLDEVARDAEVVEIGGHVARLFTDILTASGATTMHLFVQPFIHSTNQPSKYYWLIGLPTMASPQLAIARQTLRSWEKALPATINKETAATPDKAIQAKIISRKILQQQKLLPAPGSSPSAEGSRPSGTAFTRVPGSSPSQIRRQFLHHAMGAKEAAQSGAAAQSSGRLRPVKQVLSKLRHDPSRQVDDYVVGYADRKAGILEKPVSMWQDFELDDSVAYFRQVSKNIIVWDRVDKIDRL